MREKIKSFTSKRTKKLRYDFLPPMLEIMERPANPMGTFIVWAIIAIVASTIIWASVFKLDIAVSAQGYVMPKDQLISVKSLSSGVISKVFIEDSQEVKKGDYIISLEQNQLELQLKDLQYNLEILKVQHELYTQVQNQTNTKDIDIDKYGDNNNIAKAIVAEYELYLSKLKEYERTSALGEEYKNHKDSFVKEHDLSILQNLNSLNIKIHDTEASIDKVQKQISDSIIKAPDSGKVSQFVLGVEGTSISVGETICYIIPHDAVMHFEAYVSDADIRNIHVGDIVKVKISLYRDTEHEIVTGVVTKISDVAVATQTNGNCYKVDIELEETEGLVEHIGTAGSCDIIVGTRSVMDYFMEPFRKGLKESLKEQ